MDFISSIFTGAFRLLGLSNSEQTNNDNHTRNRDRTPPPPQPGARPRPTATPSTPRTFLGFTSRPTPTEHNPPLPPPPRPPPTISTTIQTALLLSRKLPHDLVPLILDHAGLWPLAARTHRPQNLSITQPHAGRIVGALLIPASIAPNSVRRIRFVTVSKDQGWSSYSADSGGYENSWTWFEAGVCRVEDSRPVSPCMSENPADPGEGVFERTCEREGYVVGPRRVVMNVHAGTEYKRHEVVWDMNSEDEGVREGLRRLRAGQRVEVSAWAMYPGWVNHVREVSIEVECHFIRKM